MVDEYEAVSVVDFVLNDARQESFGLEAHFVPLGVERFDANFGMSGHAAIEAIHAEASLVVCDDVAFVLNDFWVD